MSWWFLSNCLIVLRRKRIKSAVVFPYRFVHISFQSFHPNPIACSFLLRPKNQFFHANLATCHKRIHAWLPPEKPTLFPSFSMHSLLLQHSIEIIQQSMFQSTSVFNFFSVHIQFPHGIFARKHFIFDSSSMNNIVEKKHIFRYGSINVNGETFHVS